MKMKLIKAAGMVAVEKHGKWSLFEYCSDGEKSSLLPVNFAQDLKFLKVYEDNNLVMTPDAMYSLTGEKLLEHDGDAEIIELPAKLMVVANGGKYGKQVLIWDRKKILFKDSCTSFRYTDKCLALNYHGIWSLFKTSGEAIDEGVFQADDVEFHHDLLVAKNVGRQDLYSLKRKAFLKQDQTRIICSDICDLVLCGRIGNNALDIRCNGRWHQLPDVTEFGLIEGMEHMFYAKRGDKYFIYENMHRFMRKIYPKGVDFVAGCNGILMIVNDGEPCCYVK